MNVPVDSCTVVPQHRRPIEYVKLKKPAKMILFGHIVDLENDSVRKRYPAEAQIVANGESLDDFRHLTDSQWDEIELIATNSREGPGVENLLTKAKRVRWIHSFTSGISHLTVPEIKALDILVTNGRGAFSHALAEFSLFACNYFAKNCPRLIEAKKAKRWDIFEVEELRGRSMGIIGLGDIGIETAKIAKAFGMKIIGVRRNQSLSEEEKSIVDAIYGPEETARVMGMSDYIVAALPLTPKTNGMIDSACIRAMPPHAVFINVGRGSTVDEAALIKALQSKQIRGAALDVFEVEPLPQTSPFYELDNLLISSHCACKVSNGLQDAHSVFKKLFQKYVNGEELQSSVNLNEGY